MRVIPQDNRLDCSVALRADPYRFISRRCRSFGSDLFTGRLLLRKTVFMTGEAAARLFYDESRLQRNGAAPRLLQKTLFGEGGIQTLDDAEHLRRKQLFLALTSQHASAQLVAVCHVKWQDCLRNWPVTEQRELYALSREVLMRAVCEWAGVPLQQEEVAGRTQQISALFDQAGAVGLGHLQSRRQRKRADCWAAGLISQWRAGDLQAPVGSALAVMAGHRDSEGELLDAHTAGVELLNVLRPTVAVAVYIVFAAHALQQYPQCRQRIKAGDAQYLHAFVQEVRRVYPFFPAVVALTREAFTWQGYRFAKGRRVLLDLYGTNHDPRLWEQPETFEPERFLTTAECPYALIPQGGGERRTSHRCPGEPVALELMKTAVLLLEQEMAWELPEQDLAISFTRLPALPKNGLRLQRLPG